MEKPAGMAPASGPTIAARRDATGRAHGATGRFIRTDDPAPHIVARRARVQKLYPAKTCAEIAAELGWTAPTIWQDVKALGLTGQRRPGTRQKHPEPKERACANPECDERFTPASWEPDRRFHNIACARAAQTTERVRERARELRTEWRRRAAAEIARLNAAGYLTSRQLAAERKVTESAVSQWISHGLLKAERRLIEGEPHQIIAREEFDRFIAEEWPRIVERMGPGWPSNWRRPAQLRWQGRKAPVAAAAKGKRVGRRNEAEPWADRIDELRERGLSERAIARIIGISDSAVHRHLAAKQKLLRNP